MGSLVGVVHRDGKSALTAVQRMLNALRHRGPDWVTIAHSGGLETRGSPADLDAAGIKDSCVLGHNHLKLHAAEREGHAASLEIKEGVSLALAFDGAVFGQDAWLEEAGALFGSGEGHPTETALARIFGNRRGQFAAALRLPEGLLAYRDPLGVKPLFYGESPEACALASERKALWGAGFLDARPVKPGHAVFLSRSGASEFSVGPLSEPEVRLRSLEEAADALKSRLLEAFGSLLRSLGGPPNAAVLFSGGLDSSVVAWVLSTLGVKVRLYTLGLAGSRDLSAASDAAASLGLPLQAVTVTVEDIEEALGRVLYATERYGLMDTAIALPLFLASRAAADDGLRACFLGQGCDELFGGYARYARMAERRGYDALRKALWRDVLGLAAGSLERDDMAVLANGVEPLFPVASADMAVFAASIGPELKVSRGDGHVLKRVLRRAAEKLGVPGEVAARPKKAVQFGSGVEKAIRRVARLRGVKAEELLRLLFERSLGSLGSGSSE